jgi:hypothetical protein
VAGLYEANEASESACPGESNCDIFKSSAEDSEVRCPSCPKRQTPEQEPENECDTDVLDTIEALVNERNSGFGFPRDLTETEKELVILWDRNVTAYERAHQQRVASAIEAMIAMGASSGS